MNSNSDDIVKFIKSYDQYLSNIGKSKNLPLVNCSICCLKAPAASENSLICEMCFHEEFDSFSQGETGEVDLI